jgi:Flp pilus assembly protein TadG
MKATMRIRGFRASRDQHDDRTRSERARWRLGRPHPDERGAAAVEFAIVATLFFVLVFGIIDFGFAFHSWNNAVNAAREGARKAAVDPNPTDITNRVKIAAQTLDQSKLSISVLWSDDNGVTFSPLISGSPLVKGDIIRVIVNYQYDMLTPIGSFVPGLGSTLTLHSQSESSFEGQ